MTYQELRNWNRQMESTVVRNHVIVFDQTKVLANSSHYYPIFDRETIEICKRSNHLIKDDGIRLSKTRETILYTLK